MATPKQQKPQIAFTVARRVTVPQLRLELDREHVVTIISKFEKGKPVVTQRKVRGKDEVRENQLVPTLLRVGLVALDRIDERVNGEALHYDIVSNTVMETELTEAYPNHEYVGRTFAITRRKREGKAYMIFDIIEVALEDESEDEPEAEDESKD